MKPDTPAPDAPHLWRVLRHYLAHACTLFGMPKAIAQKLWLTRVEHRAIVAWLHPLELLLRRLIFLDALQLAPEPHAPERKSRARRSMPANGGAHFDPEHSETWRAVFDFKAGVLQRSNPKSNLVRSLTNESRATRLHLVSSAPLALRLEALIRGFNTPAPLAARLARLIRRVPRVVRIFLAAPARHLTARAGYHSVLEATQLARAAHANASAPDSS